MKQGPFELWQEAGWLQVAQWIQEDIDAGKALSKRAAARLGVQGPGGRGRRRAHARRARGIRPRRSSSRAACCRCMRASIFPEGVLGSKAPALRDRRHDAARGRCDPPVDAGRRGAHRQHQDQDARHQPRGVRGPADGHRHGREAVPGPGDLVGRRARSASAPTCRRMLPAFIAVGVSAIDDAEQFMQQTMLRMRYANVPVVSAIRGMALGGGCEMAVYSARRVAAMESYIGLVEVGVGLVPGAGGLTYIARRAAESPGPHHAQGPAAVPHRGLHRRGHGQGGHQRAGVAAARLPAGQRRHRAQQGRAAVRGAERGQGDVHRRLPPAAQAPVRRWRAAAARRPSRASWSTCATAASSASTTSTSPR